MSPIRTRVIIGVKMQIRDHAVNLTSDAGVNFSITLVRIPVTYLQIFRSTFENPQQSRKIDDGNSAGSKDLCTERGVDIGVRVFDVQLSYRLKKGWVGRLHA